MGKVAETEETGNEEQKRSNDSDDAAPKWFVWAAGAGLVWNALGVAAFFVQLTTDFSELPAAERIFHETTPVWAWAAFAIAVFSGVLGCLALILRKSWAVLMLQICLAGIIVQSIHGLILSNGIEVFGLKGLIMPLLTFGICALLVWLAAHARRVGWIN